MYTTTPETRCAKIPKMFSQKKFLKKWSAIPNQLYICKLSQPKASMMKRFPDPKLIRELPAKIKRSTLYGKVPRLRLDILALPKRRMPVETWFTPAVPSKKQCYSVSRMIGLAKPKIHVIRERHVMCHEDLAETRPNRKSLYAGMTLAERKKFRNEWIARNSRPKARPVPTPKPKKKRLTFQQNKDLIERLTVMSDRKKEIINSKKPLVVIPAKPRLPGTLIKAMNLPWIDRLSKIRKIPSETKLDMEYDPYKISKATLNAKPTKRILELAEPRAQAIKIEQSQKKDPYKVNPRSLVYKPTERMLRLAQPRKQK